VRIEVSASNKDIILAVEDDGQGFDVSGGWDQYSRVGLVGMRERANLLGAKLDIRSSPGKGTRLYLKVPLEHDG